ncbi:RNA-directed DNA polymerase from mobile element jockey-like [Rhizophagus clarus]|uniref:RNA-directed DNA polymerase from mobile element jockey-like n=1 Tax=Rhizophagus clarus TaxID=94130 RepID=A0A8H3R6X4_9GLOM|nr:RNA-directed DNA polymerase from mobile element jockey-like [Rhizophagus clarus]
MDNKNTEENFSAQQRTQDTNLNLTNIDFNSRPINNNEDLLLLNNINNLPPDHYPSYSINTNNQYTTDYLKIGSINIQRGFRTKLNSITDFFTTHNFSILGLTEIGLTQPQLFPTRQPIPIYNPASNNDISHPSGHLTLIKDTNGDPYNDPSSGIGIILNETLTKHLGKIRLHKGRCIEIELHFKNMHLLIINTYIHANNQKKKEIQELYEHITQAIAKHKALPHSQVIIMGDFNANPKGSTAHTPSWKKEIFHNLKRHHLTNTIKFFHDSLLPTRVNKEGSIPTSAIDHIYTTQHIIEHTFFSDVHTINPNLEFTTDHKAPFIIIDRNLFSPNKSLKIQYDLSTYRPSQRKKIKYNYNNMDEEKWVTFTNRSLLHLNKNIQQWLPDAYSQTCPSKYRINKKWKIIKYSIEATKHDKTVPLEPYKQRSHYKNDTPLPVRQLKNKIIVIHESLSRFSKRKLEHTTQASFDLINPRNWDDYWSNWQSIKWNLHNINKLLEMPIFTQLPRSISRQNFRQTKQTIQKGLYTCKELLKEHQLKYDLNNIDKFIIQRNNNIISNQRKMINSIMDRKPRTIQLDRLIITNPDTQEQSLTRCPETIASHVNEHFQTLGQSIQDIEATPRYRNIDDIPPQFRDTYRRSPRIPPTTYDSVLVPITLEEVTSTISSLPNHKASGVSGITYEDIKHLHINFFDFIVNFFNDILTSGTLPNGWNNAHLYPIPKPTDWGNDITNTRPIILLETFRKLFVKIITSRLHKILSNSSILQPNNRAGLSGESTFQPLQHLTHSIEMANLKGRKQELWIGLQDLSKAYDRINTSLLKLSLQRIGIPNKINHLILQLFTNRYNQVITPTGYTPSYKVIQGIDQGEVISPLMWIIYYDPLFAYINTAPISKEDRFTIIVPKKKNIWDSPQNDLPIEYTLSVQGYLDDTTWVAPSLSALNRLLSMAEDFYKIANIKINKDKYRILTNNASLANKPVAIQIQGETWHTTTLGRNDCAKILVNKILIPILEYRNQFSFLTHRTGRTPHWYEKLLSTTWSTSSMKFITPMPTPPTQRLIRHSPTIKDCLTHNPHNEWTITWDANTSDIIYGKSITQTNHPGSRSITQIQHYIQAYVETFSPTNSTNTNASTPRRMTSFLRPCKGCSRHVYNISNPTICTLYIATDKLIKIKVYRPLHIPAHITSPKRTWKFPTLHHHTLRTIAYNDYQQSQHNSNYLTPVIPVPREHSSETLAFYHQNPILNPLSPLFLKNLIIGFEQLIDRLMFLSHQFINFSDFTFYTDGSLFQDGPNKSIMGFAWIELSTSSNPTSFQGATMFQPSSTTAETFAVLTTLLVTPINSKINIFTDSLNTITNYNKFSRGNISTRQKLKFTTYPVWSLIDRLIEHKHLSVTFTKVKSHSGNTYNDQADLLSKAAVTLSPIFLSPKADPFSLMTATFDYLGPLYGNLRKWTKHACHAYMAASSLHNHSQRHLLHLMDSHPIDWSSTSQWLRKNNDNGAPCSFQNDKITGHKIKSYTHLLPTADLQQRNYPRLYPSRPILCSECNSQVYNNSHIGFCPSHLTDLNHDLQTAAQCLGSLITSSPNAPLSTRDVTLSIGRSALFSQVTDINHPIYLLLHQLVPEELQENFGAFTPIASIHGKKHAASPKRKNVLTANVVELHTPRYHVTLR